MSKTSCISHPKESRFISIYDWQLEFTEGDECAAALISYFTYCHDYKLANREKAKQANDIAEMHGDPRTQDESLMQWHTEKDIEIGILVYKRRTIAKSLGRLQASGVVEIVKNPHPRYAFDRTRYFIFHPDILSDWLETKWKMIVRERKNAESSRKNAARSGNFAARSSKNAAPSCKNAESSIIAIKTDIDTKRDTRERGTHSHAAPVYVRIHTRLSIKENPQYFENIKITRDELDRLIEDYAADDNKDELWNAFEDLENNIEAEPESQKWKRSHFAIVRKYINTAQRKEQAAY